MDICFEILEHARPGLDRSQRWDPVYISRVVITMVGENMDSPTHVNQRVLFLFMCVFHQANRAMICAGEANYLNIFLILHDSKSSHCNGIAAQDD